jgi:hypothetical protein
VQVAESVWKEAKRELNSTECAIHPPQIYQLSTLSAHAFSWNVPIFFKKRRLVSVTAVAATLTAAAVATAAATIVIAATAAAIVACFENKERFVRVSNLTMRARTEWSVW